MMDGRFDHYFFEVFAERHGQPVDLVFALLVPEEATDEHLQLLSALARMFNETELRDRLRDADPEEALAILTGHSTTHAA